MLTAPCRSSSFAPLATLHLWISKSSIKVVKLLALHLPSRRSPGVTCGLKLEVPGWLGSCLYCSSTGCNVIHYGGCPYTSLGTRALPLRSMLISLPGDWATKTKKGSPRTMNGVKLKEDMELISRRKKNLVFWRYDLVWMLGPPVYKCKQVITLTIQQTWSVICQPCTWFHICIGIQTPQRHMNIQQLCVLHTTAPKF